MENYFYYLYELIENHKIYHLDKRGSGKKDMESFLERFAIDIEGKYSRKIYKALRYIVVDQIHYIYRDDHEPDKTKNNASFSIAFHNDTYYFLLEKEVPEKDVISIKSEIDLVNSKDIPGLKALYKEILNDFEADMEFTFIDLKKRTENDISYKFIKINDNSLLRLISFLPVK
ncbi:MAG: hypothetical protein B6I20_06635 [Bacteroidetes bacterium 4572_117]|nr:MAG: hypothetical protein B6I20_06635 [Bacteroidetes bacterium 4572_117]